VPGGVRELVGVLQNFTEPLTQSIKNTLLGSPAQARLIGALVE
jgi:hypothetical protein